MKSSQETNIVADADLKRHHGEVLKGQFVEVLRSGKGKLKGIVLRTADQTYEVKLPKYLRPVLVRELAPHAFVKVWAYPDDGRWRGINITPLEEPEAIALRDRLSHSEPAASTALAEKTKKPASQPKQMCVQVCRKGKCFKQGGKQILETLQSEVAANPDLQHISVEGVGCMKACKQGPNVKLSTSKKVISGVTPKTVLDLVIRNQ
jgi:hypothetical protein